MDSILELWKEFVKLSPSNQSYIKLFSECAELRTIIVTQMAENYFIDVTAKEAIILLDGIKNSKNLKIREIKCSLLGIIEKSNFDESDIRKIIAVLYENDGHFLDNIVISFLKDNIAPIDLLYKLIKFKYYKKEVKFLIVDQLINEHFVGEDFILSIIDDLDEASYKDIAEYSLELDFKLIDYLKFLKRIISFFECEDIIKTFVKRIINYSYKEKTGAERDLLFDIILNVKFDCLVYNLRYDLIKELVNSYYLEKEHYEKLSRIEIYDAKIKDKIMRRKKYLLMLFMKVIHVMKNLLNLETLKMTERKKKLVF